MKSTIRKCDECNYETFVVDDDFKERKCKLCGGLLEIIAQERRR